MRPIALPRSPALDLARLRINQPEIAQLRFHPLFFGIIGVEEVVDMMTEMCRYKLRDIVFHKLLDSIRQLRKALVTEIVIPSDDLDPFSRLSVLHDPGSDLLVFGISRYILILSSGQSK